MRSSSPRSSRSARPVLRTNRAAASASRSRSAATISSAPQARGAQALGSRNGLYAEHGARRVTRLPLAGEPGIRIGRTTLRVHDAAHAVAPEKLLTPPRAHAAWAGGLVAALFLMLLGLQWMNLTAEPSANVLLLPLLGLATVLVLWTGVWAVLSRIFFGQARFALQLPIAAP